MNRALLSLFAVILIWSASSCNFYRRVTGRKKAVADSNLVVAKDSLVHARDSVITDTGAVVIKPAPDTLQQALLQRLSPLWDARTSWNTFNGKAKVHYEAKGESRDFAATIRMEKGRTVWVSVTALGFFEAARVLITPDTILILDRFNKEVRILPFSESGSLLPFHADFASLQSLIIGDIIQAGRALTSVTDTGSALILGHLSPLFAQSAQFDKSDLSMRFQRIDTATTSLLCEYGNRDASARRFAQSRNITMSDKGEPYNLNMEFSKADFDEPVELPFSIPEKYERK